MNYFFFNTDSLCRLEIFPILIQSFSRKLTSSDAKNVFIINNNKSTWSFNDSYQQFFLLMIHLVFNFLSRQKLKNGNSNLTRYFPFFLVDNIPKKTNNNTHTVCQTTKHVLISQRKQSKSCHCQWKNSIKYYICVSLCDNSYDKFIFRFDFLRIKRLFVQHYTLL